MRDQGCSHLCGALGLSVCFECRLQVARTGPRHAAKCNPRGVFCWLFPHLHCEERVQRDAAIHLLGCTEPAGLSPAAMDCFALLAMTLRGWRGSRQAAGNLFKSRLHQTT